LEEASVWRSMRTLSSMRVRQCPPNSSDLGRRELPFGYQARHREGDRQHRVTIEESSDAKDDADQHQPARDGKPFEASYQFGIGGAV
jgi:hypothetical protein